MNLLVPAAVLAAVVALPAFGLAAAQQAPVAAGDIVPAVWQHHQAKISYFGITTSFSCDSLGQHVRDIMLLLGARKDAKVTSSGCPRGPEVPSHTAWIDADFYTLSPADPAATPADSVKAHWVPRQITAHQPYFMDDGDCELIEQMKELVSKNFTLRDLQYRTECVPNQITLDGFAIRGQALIPVDDHSAANGAAHS